MVWAQHIKKNYAQKPDKMPRKALKETACQFHSSIVPAISSNLIKIAIL